MHQNIAVILWQFNCGKNSFLVLIPGDPGFEPSHRPMGKTISFTFQNHDNG